VFGLLASSVVFTQRDSEYRVAFAPAAQLERRLDELGREGYGCVALARPEPGSNVPGVAVILTRTTTGSLPAHRVVIGGRDDMKAPLSKNGAEGFRLCGVVLDEEPPNPRAVAVMTKTSDAAWQYDVEVLLRYKDSIARLNAIGKDGFAPVAAAPIDNNRIPEQRNWMVISERPTSGGTAREVAVRSDPGPTGLARNLNDSGKQGFHLDLTWKEGNDYVAMLSRQAGAPTPHAYVVDGDPSNGAHSLSRLALGDFPYLSRRMFVMDDGVKASNEMVEEVLPAIDRNGVVESGSRVALEQVGDHLARNRGYQVAYAHVSRDKSGKSVLSVLMAKKD
jgi:hypothetical protein